MAKEWKYEYLGTEIRVINTWTSCKMYIAGREVASHTGLTLPPGEAPLLSANFIDLRGTVRTVDFFGNPTSITVRGMLWIDGQYVAGDHWAVSFVRRPLTQAPAATHQVVYVQSPVVPNPRYEHTIERQVLVARCRYCQQITPVDLAACRNCGARGFA